MQLSRSVWIWTKTAYFRITLSRVATCFFLFSFLHCFTHAIVQSVLYSFDHAQDSRVASILKEAQVPRNEVAWLNRHSHNNFTLQLCKHVPLTKSAASTCEVIFQSGDVSARPVPLGFRRDVADQGTIPNVNSTSTPGLAVTSTAVGGGQTVLLNGQCTRVLIYANQVLSNSRREEYALAGSEFWLLGISVFAIIYNSNPHLLAGFFIRILSTGWSGYSIWRTIDIRTRFTAIITDGACTGNNFFSGYFHNRLAVQIADLSLNFVALIISCYLVWNLVRANARSTFSRVGAPPHLIKVYRWFLGIFICLQLSVYLLVTSTSLWIDQLVNGPLIEISSHNNIYIGVYTAANALLIPWISMGWFAVRREMRRTMLAFLIMGLAYIGGWSAMYYSEVFRWTWVEWPFFASLSVTAQAVQVASVIIGVVCWRNFHRGFAQWLYAEDALTSYDFEPEVFPNNADGDEEKRNFEVDFKIITLDDDAASVMSGTKK